MPLPAPTPSTEPPVDYSRLRYRLQFFLGPSFVEIFPSPHRVTIRGRWYLTAHPDLEVQVVRFKRKTLILLGFILDPDNPWASNGDILEALLQTFERCVDLFSLTARYGGRWILIADDGTRVLLFTDPAGLRQVFYSDIQRTQDLWCGSQPGVIADITGLPVDDQAYEFIRTRTDPEYWWPGDRTLYEGIKHLLPNHYLDLQAGTCRRFWPHKALQPLPLHLGVRHCAQILSGLLQSAANRFDLALPLTAGWDSRLLLAASQPIKDRLSSYTLKIEAAKLSPTHPDIAIPSALARKLGLPHEIIELPAHVDEQFADIFDRNVPLAHQIWRRDAQAILAFYRLRKVTIPGGVGEVTRNFYSLPRPFARTLTGKTLALLTGMGTHPFAIRAFDEWLSTLGQTYNFRILDLFYWEQRAGNWLAMCQKEFDIAWQDIFSPYNCRSLLEYMLGVDERYRRAPRYTLHEQAMLTLWPSVLEEPLNPHKQQSGTRATKQRIKDFLVYTKHLVIHERWPWMLDHLANVEKLVKRKGSTTFLLSILSFANAGYGSCSI